MANPTCDFVVLAHGGVKRLSKLNLLQNLMKPRYTIDKNIPNKNETRFYQ